MTAHHAWCIGAWTTSNIINKKRFISEKGITIQELAYQKQYIKLKSSCVVFGYQEEFEINECLRNIGAKMYSNRMLRKDQSLQRMIVSILLLMSYSHRHCYQRFACNAYHLPNRYNIHLVGNTDTNDSLVRCEFGGGGRNQDDGISRRHLLKDLKRKGEVAVLGNIVYNFNTEDVLAGDRMELKKRKKKSTRLDYRFFVAGGACAAVSHGVTTPIDVIKTKMQAEPEVSFY